MSSLPFGINRLPSAVKEELQLTFPESTQIFPIPVASFRVVTEAPFVVNIPSALNTAAPSLEIEFSEINISDSKERTGSIPAMVGDLLSEVTRILTRAGGPSLPSAHCKTSPSQGIWLPSASQ